ncbi:MAG: hypothetical protein JWP08_3021 [Bryobacterales bacterium]|nr:hypothetical protein [Bryobacterales bacterium]
MSAPHLSGVTTQSETVPGRDYFRGDQDSGITAPDLLKVVTFAEHVVRARGKRTAFTSVSLDRQSIKRFGECFYVLLREVLAGDNHGLVEHTHLMRELQRTANDGEKAERLLALRALQYARRRNEGLVSWAFNHSSIERKDLINWAQAQVQKYFKKC